MNLKISDARNFLKFGVAQQLSNSDLLYEQLCGYLYLYTKQLYINARIRISFHVRTYVHIRNSIELGQVNLILSFPSAPTYT